jgi:hypothetical protein
LVFRLIVAPFLQGVVERGDIAYRLVASHRDAGQASASLEEVVQILAVEHPGAAAPPTSDESTTVNGHAHGGRTAVTEIGGGLLGRQPGR